MGSAESFPEMLVKNISFGGMWYTPGRKISRAKIHIVKESYGIVDSILFNLRLMDGRSEKKLKQKLP